MYETFFKFRSRPFVAAPQTAAYFPAKVIESARQNLTRLIERGEGPGVVIGPPGTGKTLLCLLLAEQFRERFSVALVSCGRLKTCQALLQAILYELGLPCRGVDEGDLRLTLLDYLEPKPGARDGLLVLVDEAHTLPWRLLDELRMLTNVVRDGQLRVRLVLAGGPPLEEHLASPKLASFSQRIAGRCYLEPLDREETAGYVRAQLTAVGGDAGRIVDEQALATIFRASDGIPRLINQVCDHALVLAAMARHERLSQEAIDEAWADLQQLPPPWKAGSVASEAPQVVEFGKLDDREELPEAIPFRAAAERRPEAPHLAAAPDVQLEAIEAQLSKLEQSEPAPAESGTEADLDFPEFGDPFSEQFAEEEVIVEGYSSNVEIFADVPRVSSWEGQRLGSLLEEVDTLGRHQESAQRADVKITKPPEATDSADAEFVPASDPVLPEEPPRAPQAASSGAPTEGTSIDRLSGTASDRDVIVVEDEPPQASAPPAQPPGSKGEFRHLFAKLRRG
jgi:type II secretory pathway predicted ATPase ExeA